MKVFVTGAAGFIGFHLVNKLLSSGYEVVGFDNLNNYYDVNLKYDRLSILGINKPDIKENISVQSSKHPAFSFVFGHLEDASVIEVLFKKNDFYLVCNLAAQAGVRYSLEEPLKYVNSNILGFVNILEACRKYRIGHLIYASSSSVYGLNTEIPFKVSHHTDHPASLYAATKKSNEMMAHVYSHIYQLPTTGLRFFTVYGPWGRPDMAYYSFTEAIYKGKPITVFNDGRMERDFTFIDDIVEGIFKVIEEGPAKPSNRFNSTDPDPSISNAPYRIYNIGNSNPVNLLKFISVLEAELGIEAVKQFEKMQPGEVTVTYADVEDLKSNFGYQPSTSIQSGIKKFVAWYKAYYL